jgi:hypothetical protein
MANTILQQILSVFSRTTYTISPISFREQFADVTAQSLKEISIRNPMSNYDSPSTRVRYSANQIQKIYTVDKNSQRVILDNSPALENRITSDSGKKQVFYFDTMYVDNGFLIGEKSRIFGIMGKIALNSIVKVEVQNGGKRYKYDK